MGCDSRVVTRSELGTCPTGFLSEATIEAPLSGTHVHSQTTRTGWPNVLKKGNMTAQGKETLGLSARLQLVLWGCLQAGGWRWLDGSGCM